MIIITHLLFGAAIAANIKNPASAIVLAFLSHYLLDFIPHSEYSFENIKQKKWQKSLPDFMKITLDFWSGILLILLLSNNQPIIYICALSAILPDAMGFLSLVFKNRFLGIHNDFHQKKIHIFKYKRISNFWRIFNQAIIIAVTILLI